MRLPLTRSGDNSLLFVLIAALSVATAILSVLQTSLAVGIVIVVPLAVTVGAVYLRRADLFVQSMLFLAPFHFYVTEVLIAAPSITGSLSLGGLYQDIWPIGLVVIWLVHAIDSGKLVVARPPAFVIILLFVCWAVLHIVSTAPLLGALFGLRTLLRYAVLPFLLPVLLTSPKQLKRIFLAGMLGMALASAASLGDAPAFIREVLAQGTLNLAALPADLRFVGIFRNAGENATAVSNSFGIALALLAIYAVGRAYAAKSMSSRLFYIVCVGLLGAFLLLTFSRRGYFTLVFGTGLLLWLWRSSSIRRIRILLVLGIAFAILVTILQALPIGELIIGRSTMRVFDNPSFAGRQYDWLVVWQAVLRGAVPFLWGFGMGSTGPIGLRFGVANSVHVHNYYMLLWHQLGLIGLALFLALLGGVVIYGIRVAGRLRYSELSLEVWFSVVVVIALALNGLLGTTFEAYPNDMLFWTAIALLAAGKRIAQQETRELYDDQKPTRSFQGISSLGEQRTEWTSTHP